MNRPVLLSVLCLVAPLAAQEPQAPQPTEQAKSLHRLVGSYTGSGVARAAKGAADEKWEATLVARPLFEGFFVHEELEVRLGAPTPMRMSTVYGWDGGHDRMFNASVSNMGGMIFGELTWADEDTLVSMATAKYMGQLAIGRATWHFTDDGFTYRHEKAVTGGEWFTEVEGEFHKAEARMPAYGPAFVGMEVPAEQQKLVDALSGNFRLEGEMTMPGMPESMKIGGNERVRAVYGGHVLISQARSDPMPEMGVWQGLNAFAWDPDRGHYWSLMVDSTGEVSHAPMWWVDGQLVSVESRVSMGLPTVNRTVIEIGEHGMTGFEAHSISGTDAPYRSFKCSYERVQR